MGMMFVNLDGTMIHDLRVTPPRSTTEPSRVTCTCGWEDTSDIGSAHVQSLGNKHLAEVTHEFLINRTVDAEEPHPPDPVSIREVGLRDGGKTT